MRAPELIGEGGWLNTGGTDLALADLRGRIVLLDFWTFCCVNCLHVLDELRELEERHRDTLVIVGVHSPKFAHEAEHRAVVDAVERYQVEHPVLDDPQLATWKQYAVRAWPTLVVVDPEGYVVAQHAGEGHGHAIATLVEELEREHARKGTLRRGDAPYVPPEPVPTDLRFPGKALRLPGGGAGSGGGNFLVSDTTRHQLVELAPDGETVLRRVGTGERGLTDGASEQARFSEPQGLALLPGTGTVVVADTVNHALRGFDPVSGEVVTLAGTGAQWWQGAASEGPAREVSLSSPWDVEWFDGRLWIAMAGVHQLWTYEPPEDGAPHGTVRVEAGTTNEGLVDGPVAQAWFAQPSGLSASDDGQRLWIADSETSAVRWIERAGEESGGAGELVVRTAVGTGLFDFGHRDGKAGEALLQHPLGVTALPGGRVAVSDTYNHALRCYDPQTDEVTTLATDLREPSDAVLVDDADGAGPAIVVVESARHRLTRLRLPEEAVRVEPVAHRTQRSATEVAPGELLLDVVFQAPKGQKLDDRYGPPTRLLVSSTPPELLADGAGGGTDLGRTLRLAGGVSEGVLHVSAMAASCDEPGAAGESNEFPACHVHQQDWGVPVRVTDSGTARLALVLAGMDDGSAAGTDASQA